MKVEKNPYVKNKMAMGSMDLTADRLCIILLTTELNPYFGVATINMSTTTTEERARQRYVYTKSMSLKCTMVSLQLVIILPKIFSSNQNSCHDCCDKYITKAVNSDLDCILLYKLFNKYL